MTIIEKKEQLKTLFALGIEIVQIKKIFIYQSNFQNTKAHTRLEVFLGFT